MASPLDGLVGCHPIFSCEGTAEQVVVRKLLEADVLVFPAVDVVEVTRKRKASDIQADFLGFDYDWPVCIVRVLDSRKERFRLGNLYADRFPVASVVTHPEMEVLAIIREGEWDRWRRTKKKPSDFCKQDLCMKGIKSEIFLSGYWSAHSIRAAALEYRRLSNIPKGEVCLADLIAQ